MGKSTLASVTGGLNATLQYSVAVNSPGLFFRTADLDVTHIRPETSVVKDIFADSGFTTLLGSLASPNGIPSMNFNIAGLYTTLYIRDTVVLDPNGSIAGFTNVYTLQPSRDVVVATPEPASLALIAMGGLNVLGVLVVRRRKANPSAA